MRYIRVFSELSNQIRFANQKRVLIELAFIKLTKPEMEQSMDSVLERLEKLERMVEEMSAGGYVPVQTAGMDGESHDKCRAADPAAGIRAAGLQRRWCAGKRHGPLRAACTESGRYAEPARCGPEL